MVKHLVLRIAVAASFVTLSATAVAADRSPSRLDATRLVLTMAMSGPCAASEETLELARTEASRIWSRGGVGIRWVSPAQLPYGAPASQWLVVRCEGAGTKPQADATAIPIAAIRFVSARPTNTIVLSVQNAITLLQRDAKKAPGAGNWFVPFRKVHLGRMLGRAMAHEVGHFLSQSGGHTANGLMRASHTVAAFTGASLGPFQVPDVSQD